MILREHLVKNDIGESSDFSFATITPYHPSWASGRDIFSHEDITFIEHEEVEKTHDNSLVFSDKWNQVYERNEKHEVELSSCGFVVSAFISVREMWCDNDDENIPIERTFTCDDVKVTPTFFQIYNPSEKCINISFQKSLSSIEMIDVNRVFPPTGPPWQ